MTMLLKRIFLNFLTFIPCTTKDYRNAVFFISVYSVLKRYPSLLDTTGILVLPHNFINSLLFTATCYNSPSARCVVAANRMCKDLDICRKTVTSLTQILH
jgi:hypothetical protein